MWIGDFVRGHTVVRVLTQRWPNRRSICCDVAMRSMIDLQPGVRSGIIGLAAQPPGAGPTMGLAAPAARIRHGADLPRTWKSALAPALAGIPNGGGSSAEARFGLLKTVALGVEGPCPASSQRNAALAAAGRGAVAAGNGQCRSSTSRRGKPPAGGKPMGGPPVPPWRWPGWSARPSAYLLSETAGLLAKWPWMYGWWRTGEKRSGKIVAAVTSRSRPDQ